MKTIDTANALWNLELLRTAIKKKWMPTTSDYERLGTLEILHDSIHRLGGDCGAPHCSGADKEILAWFIDRAT